ncbi:MAG TPA: aminotransferase class V-fold PLP-dependent enzyme [Actinomycetota bacterium]|nr:aminotransferase class V-fold PLP-dependent enzyme [Actinomycetota bacterium]
MGEAALEYVIRFISGLDDAPAVNAERSVEVARALRASPSETGGDFGAALKQFAAAAANGFEPAGPGYLAFVPGGGVFSSSLADFLAKSVNRFPNLGATAPGIVQIEMNVIRWICDLFGYPPEARGILTTGGSTANLSAIVTARRARLGDDFLDGTYYLGEQAHASVAKAATIAGFSPRNLRQIPVDAELRMRVDALREQIRADRAAGLRPFLVVPNAGSTNTGAIDPMDEIADVAAEEGLWMHADAAYGGFFVLTERGRHRLRGIDRSDSVTLDPHKGLFLPYGVGSLVVRDGATLRAAHYSGADYLQDVATEGELPNLSEYSIELSRDFRGLRVWLPLQLHGVATFRDLLDEKLDLAEYLHEALVADPTIEVPWRPQLTVVAFRLHEGDENANRRFLERINASRRVFCSSTLLDGRFTIRACILNHRTHRDRVDEAIEIIGKAAAEA